MLIEYIVYMNMESDVKAIVINGKNSRYQMKKLSMDVYVKDVARKLELSSEFYTHRIQVDVLKCIIGPEEGYPLQYVSVVPVFVRHIKEKLRGYLSQDRMQDRMGTGVHISYADAVQKLVSCGQKCYYCLEECLLLYTTVRDPMQWTFDRIDNEVCHSRDNVVVSCLACNLTKRRRGKEAFRATKQLVIDKQDDDDELSSSDLSDVFADVAPDMSDPFSHACSNIEYSYDT